MAPWGRRARSPRLAVLMPALVFGLALQGMVVGSASAAPAAQPAGPTPVARSESRVVHRVVWDDAKPRRGGIHLRTARVDGSDSRRLFDIPRGFTTQLTLDRLGRRVAFATCCRADLPRMLVVRLRDGKVLEPLARHPDFYAVGGIGWSPSGRRIAFEGFVKRGQREVEGLWTVRPDGTGLRHVIDLDGIHESWVYVNPSLAWTRDGILYCDGADLRVARAGRSQVLLPRVNWVRISGNGRHLVMERPGKQRLSIWISARDTSRARRLFGWPAGTLAQGRFYRSVTPDFSGRRLLAEVDRPGLPSQVVVWNVADGPRSGRVLEWLGDNDVVAWN